MEDVFKPDSGSLIDVSAGNETVLKQKYFDNTEHLAR